MVREELIEGAVSFLQDPSVAAAPLEQRTAFLRSKNLTPEEIDVSLARVGQSPNTTTAQPPPANYQQQPRAYPQAPPPQQYAYQQQPPPYWNQPPPELPRRDWRDWFIMATVTGGVGYAMYWTARRYIVPLIAPPTPPQLEADKASIDTSFDKAFALLDQLATDTAELKESEQARTARLDAALSEVESVIGRMKGANESRELESKRIARELADLREQIPKAIEKERESTDGRLRDLAGEMRSLKTLVGTRMQQAPAPVQQPRAMSTTNSYTPSAPAVNGAAPAVQTPLQTNGAAQTSGTGQTNGATQTNATTTESPGAAAFATATTQASTPPPSRTLPSRAQIPSWQLAAKKRTEEAKTDGAAPSTPTPGKDVSESGTVVPEVDTEGGSA
ncbi:hypothetical protein LTR08_009313 [Meristemomyces frigidus]|nr:hypothetical protein LTR08_009313 [Meristemomyces frigidus]